MIGAGRLGWGALTRRGGDRRLRRNRVGFAAAPADARPEIREVVDHVCVAPGGFGAVREVIEVLMKAQGTWGDVLESQGLA